MKRLMLAVAVILSLFEVFAKNQPKLDTELVKLIEENKQTELQNFLKTKKVSVDSKNAALRLAVEKNRVNIACMLINNGANPNIKDENGITPLMIAAIKNYPSMASMLMKMNGDSSIKDNEGNTALDHSVLKNNMEVFRELTYFKGPGDGNPELLVSALYYAIHSNHIEMVKFLIEENPKLLNNAFHIAIKSNHIEIVKILIEELNLAKNRFYDNSNNIKETEEILGEALCSAVESNRIEMVKFLIEQGADLEYFSYYDGTPLMLSRAREHKDIEKLLIEKGANVNVTVDPYECSDARLRWACMTGNYDLAKLLLEKGANANASRWDDKYEEYESVMVLANNWQRSEENCIKLMKLLLEYGADIDAREGAYKRTVLNEALRQKRYAIAKFLLKNGANIFATDERGCSPILRLIEYAVEKVIDFVKQKIRR